MHGDGDDDPQVWYTGSGVSSPMYLFADHQGSIVAVTDANGSVTSTIGYDEYGITRNNANGLTVPYGRFGYTGQAWLYDLGMYYYKARLYSPTLGRFLQTDPIGYDDQINLYAYVANDPIMGRDPTGTETCTTDSNGNRTCVPDDHTFRDRMAAAGAAAGAVVGGVAGGAAGGTGGAVAGAACGPGAVACPPAGAAAGGAAGAAAGAAGGAVAGGVVGGLIGNLIDKGIAMTSSNGGKGGGDGYKSSASGTGKDKATDAPSWAKNDSAARPRIGESPNQSATRVMDAKYGEGNYPRGPGSEFNKIQK